MSQNVQKSKATVLANAKVVAPVAPVSTTSTKLVSVTDHPRKE